MTRFKVEVLATLTIEIDAPREAAAIGAIRTMFKPNRAMDMLQGTRINIDSTEHECDNAMLMTTVVNPGDDATAEPV